MKFATCRAIGALLLTCLFMPLTANAGFSVQNGQIRDNNGAVFVMRGINYPHAWYTARYPTQTQQDFANMSATGANVVRIVLGSGAQYTRTSGAELTNLIQWCKTNSMIAMLEVHDSTGWGDIAFAPNAVPISNAVSYWTSSDVRAAIAGQEDFVIVNIANEPFGNNTTPSNYVNDTMAAIRSLRSAGITHHIHVDAGNWGQDWSGTTRSAAVQIFNADTARNVSIGVHMYESYQNSAAVSTYMQAYAGIGVPLVVGEFGSSNNGAFVDAVSVMAQAQQRGIGYIGWSWSGNGGCCVALDITNSFNASSLTTWGSLLINGANGIRQTSVRATVFGPGTGNNLTVSPTSLALGSAASNGLVAVTANVSWTATDNQTWLTVSPTGGSNNGNITVSATANTGTASRSGTVTVSGGGITREVAVTQSGTQTQVSNLAQGKPCLASSTDASAGACGSAFDGNTGTRWSSAFSQPQWIQVDLQATYTINRVLLNWEAAYGNGYQIQVSPNGTTWTTILTVTNGNGATDDLAVSGTGRYVRMNGTSRATQWGFSLWEFQVFGTTGTTNNLSVSPGSLSMTSGAGSSTISVTSNVSWTAADNATWLTLSPTSGSNNGSITVTAAANTGSASRAGIVTVSGGPSPQTVTVTQAGTNQQASCNWQGTVFPMCANDQIGWGSENGATCISQNLCNTQTGGACNWYGSMFPTCAVDNGNWGWENNQSCISRSLCATQQ